MTLKWTLTRKSAEMTEVKGSPLKVIRLLDKALLILIQNYGFYSKTTSHNSVFKF